MFLLFYTIFINVAAASGFGQPVAGLALDDAVRAVKWEMVGQSFAVLGMAVAKVSLGAFLLRLVVARWHRAAVWAAMASLLAVSLLTLVVFWIQCLPPAAIFDPRVGGRCIVPVAPFAVLLGGTLTLSLSSSFFLKRLRLLLLLHHLNHTTDLFGAA